MTTAEAEKKLKELSNNPQDYGLPADYDETAEEAKAIQRKDDFFEKLKAEQDAWKIANPDKSVTEGPGYANGFPMGYGFNTPLQAARSKRTEEILAEAGF